jgi:hypothetical protein
VLVTREVYEKMTGSELAQEPRRFIKLGRFEAAPSPAGTLVAPPPDACRVVSCVVRSAHEW